MSEVAHRDVEVPKGSAEDSERAPDAFGVIRRWLDPDVNVYRGAWISMNGERMRADHEKARLLGYERGEEVTVVFVHRTT